MSQFTVPSAPVPGYVSAVSSSVKTPESPLRRAQLDPAFIGRIYRSMLWFGLVMTLLLVPVWHSYGGTFSFAAGLVLAALLLRTQEVVVRAVLRTPTGAGGLDSRLLLVLLLPLKYLVVIAVLGVALAYHWLRPEALAAGFFAGQLVLVAKVIGWMSQNRRAVA